MSEEISKDQPEVLAECLDTCRKQEEKKRIKKNWKDGTRIVRFSLFLFLEIYIMAGIITIAFIRTKSLPPSTTKAKLLNIFTSTPSIILCILVALVGICTFLLFKSGRDKANQSEHEWRFYYNAINDYLITGLGPIFLTTLPVFFGEINSYTVSISIIIFVLSLLGIYKQIVKEANSSIDLKNLSQKVSSN